MRPEPKPEERQAFALVASELGLASVDHSLEQTAPGQVDALLIYPSGQQAALEVSIVCDEQAVKLASILGKRKFRWQVNDSRLWWSVTLDPGTNVKEFGKYLPEALKLHEQHGILAFDDMFSPNIVDSSPALQWFEKHQVSVVGFTNVTDEENYPLRHPGTVNVTPGGRGGVIGSANIVPKWLSDRATTAGTQVWNKLAKLARSGYAEQHLFLFVDYSADTFEFAWVVGDDEEIPTEPPNLGHATDLWLVAMSSSSYLRWSRARGWTRQTLPTQAPA